MVSAWEVKEVCDRFFRVPDREGKEDLEKEDKVGSFNSVAIHLIFRSEDHVFWIVHVGSSMSSN